MGIFGDFVRKMGFVRSVEDEVRHRADTALDADREKGLVSFSSREEKMAAADEYAKLLAGQQARQDALSQERAEDAWGMREEEGIPKADAAVQSTLSQEAARDIQQVMERGYHEEYDREGFVESTHFSELGRSHKLKLLEQDIDWDRYIERGMHPDTPPKLMFNAVDGKPPEKWLEQTPEEAKSREAELDGYARQFEAAAHRISVGIQERKQMTDFTAYEKHLAEQAAKSTKDLGKGFEMER